MAKIKLNAGNPVVTTSTNILDIEIPKEMENNVRTGLEHLDMLCCGDGMTPSSVLLLTGIPGAGKSTLGLQLADAINGQGHIVLYNTGEESLFQVRKTARRLDLKHGFRPNYITDVEELIKYCNLIRKENPGKQFFLIQDSLQYLRVKREPGKRGRELSGMNMTVVAAEMLTAWAKETFSVVILIGQVTKDGVFAGKQEIKHAVDCHLHLAIDTDRKSDTYGERVAEMQKNRFGPAGLYYPFSLGKLGLKFRDEAQCA